MNKRILAVLAFSCVVALGTVSSAENTPSEASIKQLLELAQVHKLQDGLFGQMDGYMKQALQQETQCQRITPDIERDIERRETEIMAGLKEILDWNKLEPMYVRVYQKSFTQSEVDGLIAFYQNAGRSGSDQQNARSNAEHDERNARVDEADATANATNAAGSRGGNTDAKAKERRLSLCDQTAKLSPHEQ